MSTTTSGKSPCPLCGGAGCSYGHDHNGAFLLCPNPDCPPNAAAGRVADCLCGLLPCESEKAARRVLGGKRMKMRFEISEGRFRVVDAEAGKTIYEDMVPEGMTPEELMMQFVKGADEAFRKAGKEMTITGGGGWPQEEN